MARFDDLPPEILRMIVTFAFENHHSKHPLTSARHPSKGWFKLTQATTYYFFPLGAVNRRCCDLSFEVTYIWVLGTLRGHAVWKRESSDNYVYPGWSRYERRVQNWIGANHKQKVKWQKMASYVQKAGMRAAEEIWHEF